MSSEQSLEQLIQYVDNYNALTREQSDNIDGLNQCFSLLMSADPDADVWIKDFNLRSPGPLTLYQTFMGRLMFSIRKNYITKIALGQSILNQSREQAVTLTKQLKNMQSKLMETAEDCVGRDIMQEGDYKAFCDNLMKCYQTAETKIWVLDNEDYWTARLPDGTKAHSDNHKKIITITSDQPGLIANH